MNLAVTYRPTTFENFIGNSAIVISLKNYFSTGSLPHSLLFSGPKGCGKTTLARLIANELKANALDVKELNIADTRGIDDARRILEEIQYKPFGPVRVLILDECHLANNYFQNALLKVIEEPGENTYFVLCTTDPKKLLPTIKSRCIHYKVQTLSDKELRVLLLRIVVKEKQKLPHNVLDKIIKVCEGCPREALNLFEQCVSCETEETMLTILSQYKSETALIIDLCRALSKNTKWLDIVKIIQKIEGEPEQIRFAVLNYQMKLLLSGVESKAAKSAYIIECFSKSFIETGKAGFVSACYLASLANE